MVEDIILKIQKLLALSKKSNENEQKPMCKLLTTFNKTTIY